MSYKSILSTVFGKRPVWLYKISMGSQHHYLTTRSGGVTTPAGKPSADFVSPTTWVSTPLHRGKMKKTGNILEAEIDISLPTSLPISVELVASTSNEVSSVTIWHGFENDPDGEYVQRFEGRITSVQSGIDWVKLGCENDETISKRQQGSVVIQRPCRHVIYNNNTGCPVNINDHLVAGTIIARNGKTLTFTESESHDDGWYANGVLVYAGSRQMIIGHEADSLTMLESMPQLDADITANGFATVSLARGCRNIHSDCVGFGAHLDFGGFQYLTETPFDGRLLS